MNYSISQFKCFRRGKVFLVLSLILAAAMFDPPMVVVSDLFISST